MLKQGDLERIVLYNKLSHPNDEVVLIPLYKKGKKES